MLPTTLGLTLPGGYNPSDPGIRQGTVYGFADADHSYVVFIPVKDPAKAEEFQQNAQPALLASVTLGGE